MEKPPKLTPEQKKKLAEAREKWRKRTEHLRESIRRSMRLTAADMQTTINARDDDLQPPKKIRRSKKKRE